MPLAATRLFAASTSALERNGQKPRRHVRESKTPQRGHFSHHAVRWETVMGFVRGRYEHVSEPRRKRYCCGTVDGTLYAINNSARIVASGMPGYFGAVSRKVDGLGKMKLYTFFRSSASYRVRIASI